MCEGREGGESVRGDRGESCFYSHTFSSLSVLSSVHVMIGIGEGCSYHRKDLRVGLEHIAAA